MDGWSKLCRDEDVVGVVLERVKAGALCERMRRAVRTEVERPGVRLAEVEKTVYDCIVSSGALAVLNVETPCSYWL